MSDRDDHLAALFRAAAGDPPPGFDHDAVVARSRQVTARRRTALLGAAGALVVVLGTGVALSGQAQQESAAPAAAPAVGAESGTAGDAGRGAAGAAAPEAGAAAAPQTEAAPFALQPVPAGPLGPGTAPCVDRQDPALRALVDGVLPEVAGAPAAAVTEECRPGGAREVNLEVVDGGASGVLTVASLPAGEPVLQPQEAAVATATTASGGTVVVRSRGDGPGAPAPFADRLDAVATALAPVL